MKLISPQVDSLTNKKKFTNVFVKNYVFQNSKRYNKHTRKKEMRSFYEQTTQRFDFKQLRT